MNIIDCLAKLIPFLNKKNSTGEKFGLPALPTSGLYTLEWKAWVYRRNSFHIAEQKCMINCADISTWNFSFSKDSFNLNYLPIKKPLGKAKARHADFGCTTRWLLFTMDKCIQNQRFCQKLKRRTWKVQCWNIWANFSQRCAFSEEIRSSGWTPVYNANREVGIYTPILSLHQCAIWARIHLCLEKMGSTAQVSQQNNPPISIFLWMKKNISNITTFPRTKISPSVETQRKYSLAQFHKKC